jgi:hypothetical protein
MKTLPQITTCLLCLAFLAGRPAPAQESRPTLITIFADNLGMVREHRTFDFKQGANEFKLTDLPAQLDPTSVRLAAVSAPGNLAVVEQNFAYDLVSDAKLLERYLNRPIKITTRDGSSFTGTLISGVKKQVPDRSMYGLGREPTLFNPTNQPVIDYSYMNLVLARDPKNGPVVIVEREGNIREIELPMQIEDLIVTPTLAFKVLAAEGGRYPCEISYQTRGMSWRADYILVLAADDHSADLTGWATISNTSGGDFPEAEIRLMAGEARRQKPGESLRVYKYGKADPDIVRDSSGVLPVSDYHLYPLSSRTRMSNNETKQVQLIHSVQVPAAKFYVYDGAQIVEGYGDSRRQAIDPAYGTQTTNKVAVYVELEGGAKGLGRSLPSGKFRVYKRDVDDNPELVGEDFINHTPPGEMVRLRLGYAFDLVGERRQTDFKVVSPGSPAYGGGVYEESVEIAVRNHKTEAVEVRVMEHLYRWTDWEILEKSRDYEKLDAQTVEFRVRLGPGEEQTTRYRVRYRF